MVRDHTTSIALQAQQIADIQNGQYGATLDELQIFPGGRPRLSDWSLGWAPWPPAPHDTRLERGFDFFPSIRPQLDAGLEIVPAEGNRSAVYRAVKRTFDILGTIVLLIIFSPIMLVTFLLLMLTTGGRPLFRQTRLGLRGRPFTMYKFRTMTIDAESQRHNVENEQDGPVFKNRTDSRVTRIGRFLRVTSIDEMPQLLNVLAGQMSLVGPRPPIGEEVAQYEPWQRRRLAVKPGLTCLWQVSGRSDIDFHRWVEMDLWYIDNQNFLTDLSLLLRTPGSVLSRRGAY